jgi:phage gp16-like protein
MNPAEKKWKQVLHIAKKECNLDDESYRALLSGAAGVESSSDIKTWEQYNNCLADFKKLGFQVRSGTGTGFRTNKKGTLKQTETQAGRHSDYITEKQEYYIRGLWDLASKEKSLHSLNNFVKRITGVASVTWLTKVQATKVITALQVLTKKAGFDPEKPVDRVPPEKEKQKEE